MTAGPISSAAPLAGAIASEPQSKPKNAAEVAKEFEALLIAQMLRTAHESGPNSLDEENSSADTMFDLAGQQFAQVLANNGGLGLAKMITQGLQKR